MGRWNKLLITKFNESSNWFLNWLVLSVSLLSGCGFTAISNDGVVGSMRGFEIEQDSPGDPSNNNRDQPNVYDASNLPQNILTVLPWPGEVITLAEYNSLAKDTQAASTVPSVCLGIQPTLEPEDFFTSPAEWFDQKTTVVIDGETIPNDYELVVTDAPDSNIYYDDGSSNPVVVARIPSGSPYFVCYPVSLGVGKHIVTFSYKNSSGKLFDYWGEPTEYSWEFAIVGNEK